MAEDPSKAHLIADFRGVPLDDTFSARASGKAMGSIIETCFARYGIGKESPQETVLRNWRQIIGPHFCDRCAPEKIDASAKLVIRVENPILRRELHFMEDRIMTALRSLPGCTHIRGIVFRAG